MDNEKLKILIVDDEPDILEILKINLKRRLQGILSFQWKKGLKKADLIIPDLIILDIMMPIMDGIETCERLRLDERFKETIVIFLTARGEEYSHIAAFESGADDYITKPVRIKILISKIKALFRRKLATGNSSENLLLKTSKFWLMSIKLYYQEKKYCYQKKNLSYYIYLQINLIKFLKGEK